MNNLWLEKTGFVVLTLVLLGMIIMMVSVFWPAQTPTAETTDTKQLQKADERDLAPQPQIYDS